MLKYGIYVAIFAVAAGLFEGGRRLVLWYNEPDPPPSAECQKLLDLMDQTELWNHNTDTTNTDKRNVADRIVLDCATRDLRVISCDKNNGHTHTVRSLKTGQVIYEFDANDRMHIKGKFKDLKANIAKRMFDIAIQPKTKDEERPISTQVEPGSPEDSICIAANPDWEFSIRHCLAVRADAPKIEANRYVEVAVTVRNSTQTQIIDVKASKEQETSDNHGNKFFFWLNNSTGHETLYPGEKFVFKYACGKPVTPSKVRYPFEINGQKIAVYGDWK